VCSSWETAPKLPRFKAFNQITLDMPVNGMLDTGMPMHFLERYLHISPDGGSGMTEAGYLLSAALLLLVWFRRSALRYAWRACIKFLPAPRC
jgi:hypothetical protein